MLLVIERWVYRLVVATRVFFYAYPVIETILFKIRPLISKMYNCQLLDTDEMPLKAIKLNGRILPPFGLKRLTTVDMIEIRDDDILICGYPKTGCHWTYEIVYMLTYKCIKLSKYGKRIGMIDFMPDFILDSSPSPRVLNSHLLYEELPAGIREKKTKVIWTVRSPKDVSVSYYHHTVNLSDYRGTFDSFFEMFVSGKIIYGDYLRYILDWDRVKRTQKDNPILVVEYEQLKSKPVNTVLKIAEFLEIDITKDFAVKVLNACGFEVMKKARASSYQHSKLFRKGIVGDWRTWLMDAQSTELEEKYRKGLAGCEIYQPTTWKF